MTEISGESFKKLSEDREFIVSRGRREADGLPILLLAPAAVPLPPARLTLLQRLCALRDDLDSSWAARPLELVEFNGRYITLRFTAEEVEKYAAPLKARIADLEAQIAARGTSLK